MLLANKNVIVYGAGGAIGGAVSRAFAREGARVFLTGRTLSKLEAVAREIVGAGGRAEPARVDALDERAVNQHADTVLATTEGIDVSFNAVGLADVELGTPLVEMTVDRFAYPVAAAMRTQFLTAQAVARHMSRRGSGVIMTITSTHARLAVPNFGGVGATQSAIEGLYRQLAGELGPRGVRVICLRSSGSPDAPGLDRVGDMMARTSGVSREQLEAASRAAIPMRRFPLLAEVGNVAVLLASDHAAPMTGAIANISCGAVLD